MSRLIFEGDTTERFGRYFPKPFIEEVRAYDTVIQTDVGLYFQIDEDVQVTEFLNDTELENLTIVVAPILSAGLDVTRENGSLA